MIQSKRKSDIKPIEPFVIRHKMIRPDIKGSLDCINRICDISDAHSLEITLFLLNGLKEPQKFSFQSLTHYKLHPIPNLKDERK